DARGEVFAGDPVGHPLIAERHHPIEHVGPVTAYQDRRVRLLDGLGPAPDPLEVHVAPRVAGLLLGPDRLHRLDPLAHDPESLSCVGAVVGHLLNIPARAHPEQKTTTGYLIVLNNLDIRSDRIALYHASA